MKEMNSWIEVDRRSAPQMIRAIDGKNFHGRVLANELDKQSWRRKKFFNSSLDMEATATKSAKEITQDAWKKRPLIISGPCSAETEEQTVETISRLAKTGKVDMVRAGIWKPRTRPGRLRVSAPRGLPWREQARKADRSAFVMCGSWVPAGRWKTPVNFDIDAYCGLGGSVRRSIPSAVQAG